MSTSYLPSTEEIAVAFTDEISGLGGSVSDSYDDGGSLFMRALLTAHDEVRPGDRVNAGIALRATGPLVAVHPYTFRQLCSNGAIAAHVTQTRHIARVEYVSATDFVAAAIDEVRLVTRQCAAPEAFIAVVDEMRRASAAPAELMIHLVPMLAHLRGPSRRQLLALITAEFARENDPTLFGVMNAITAVARETRDPETKWRLEQYGGAIPALARQAQRPPARELELIGA